ncbi:hypothetical protein ACQP2P_25930 [Dactylosporangium sp. CA-139114]|uniref:hypothetical protein n=1 Tax=Dactylosporangium sp. CA-139114 TaxID=3239931 RepID=UPI003D998B67
MDPRLDPHLHDGDHAVGSPAQRWLSVGSAGTRDRAAGHDERRGRSGGAPVAGFSTWSEFARLRGITGHHNQTLVVLAVG